MDNMKCPYCGKEIIGMTGLQEARNFEKHLRKCKKHPDRKTFVEDGGHLNSKNPPTDLLDALNRRADSGQ